MNVDNPIITVVVPTYRRPQFLKRAIRSLLQQTYPFFRIKIFDNASGDNTRQVVMRFQEKDSRVEYYCRPRNIGPVANIDEAFKTIDTPLFTCLSDDDIALPNFFLTSVQNFQRYPDAMFSGGACLGMSMDGRIYSIMPIGWKKKWGYFRVPEGLAQMLGKNPLQNMLWTSLVFKTELFARIGGIDLDLGLPVDIDYIYRCASRFPFVLSEEPVAIFTFHGQNWTYTVDSFELCQSWLRIFEKLTSDSELSQELRDFIHRASRYQVENFIYSHIVKSLALSKVKEARELNHILKNYSLFKNWWAQFLIRSQEKQSISSRVFFALKRNPFFLSGRGGENIDEKYSEYKQYFDF